MEVTFTAPDIECAGCAASIEKALGRGAGVESVTVTVPAKTVTVQYDEGRTDRKTLAETLADIGFPPQERQP